MRSAASSLVASSSQTFTYAYQLPLHTRSASFRSMRAAHSSRSLPVASMSNLLSTSSLSFSTAAALASYPLYPTYNSIINHKGQVQPQYTFSTRQYVSLLSYYRTYSSWSTSSSSTSTLIVKKPSIYLHSSNVRDNAGARKKVSMMSLLLHLLLLMTH